MVIFLVCSLGIYLTFSSSFFFLLFFFSFISSKPCDTLANINVQGLEEMSTAAAFVVYEWVNADLDGFKER